MQTAKKKKIKITKKQKHHQIQHTTETFDEQAFLEHKVASETHKQNIKTVSLGVAPEYIELFMSDEKSLPMETCIGPKPFEIQSLFHASNTKAVSITESGICIHLKDSPTQKCLVNITESTPIMVTEVDNTETVGTREPYNITPLHELSSTLVTRSASVSDQVIPCDNVNVFYISVPNLKQATESIRAQSPIQIDFDVGESRNNIHNKYEPKTRAALCRIISNTALNSQENSPVKFYPETFIATEEAVQKYDEKISYQTQEICTSEIGNAAEFQGIPKEKQARLEFNSLQAITMEQADINESDTQASVDLIATAKDTFDVHKETHTGFSQPIETVHSYQRMHFPTKQASSSVDEMDGKFIEVVNVSQSEEPLDVNEQPLEREPRSSYISRKCFSVSEILVQENDTELLIPSHVLAGTSKSQQVQNIIEKSSEHSFDAISDHKRIEKGEALNVQNNFELQKSIIRETAVSYESEQAFDTKLQTNQPHYSLDSKLKDSLLISEVQLHNVQLTTEPTIQAEAMQTKVLCRTYEQQDEQFFYGTHEYDSDAQMALSAHIDFELQKSTIGETVIAQDSEQVFETKMIAKQPHYKTERNLKHSIVISETQVQQNNAKFSPGIIEMAMATVVQEPHEAPDFSEDQMLETVNEYIKREKLYESSAHVDFELQKSMISETTLVQDTEKAFETSMREMKSQYKFTPNVSNAIVVSETQLIDSETLFDAKSRKVQHLTISDAPKQFSPVGCISESVLYDSTEAIPYILQEFSAKKEPILHHEVTVDMPTVSECLDRLEVTKLDEKQTAASCMSKNKALNVIEQSSESSEKFNVSVDERQFPKLKTDSFSVNALVVDDTKTSEHLTKLDTDLMKEATAVISRKHHNIPHIDEKFIMEIPANSIKTSATRHRLSHQFVQSSAVETSENITCDSFKELRESQPKPMKSKVLLNEQKGIVTEDIIPQENAIRNKFTLNQKTEQLKISRNFEQHKRCEKFQENTFENISSFQIVPNERVASIIKTISHALPTARIEEVQAILFSETFEDEKPSEQLGKIVHNQFNVVFQSLLNIPIECDGRLFTEPKTRGDFPKASIDGLSFYGTSEIALPEKEAEIIPEAYEESQLVKEATEHTLPVANVSFYTALADVKANNKKHEEIQMKNAVSKFESLLEGINIENMLVHEMSSDVVNEEPKTKKAKSVLECKESEQVENIPTLDKKKNFERTITEQKECDQKFERHLKSAVSEIIKPIEQTSKQAVHESQIIKSKEVSSKINEGFTLESVYLKEEADLYSSAQIIIDKMPANSINVNDQIPLYKETKFDDEKMDKKLTKLLVKTQQTSEINIATKQNEINTHVNIKTNKKADKNTNMKITKKLVERTYSDHIGGKWKICIKISIFPLQEPRINTHNFTLKTQNTHTIKFYK